MSETTANDGNGLYDNFGLIDTLIVDCNELPKALCEGQYVRFCAKIVEMVHKLTNLKKGIRNDTDSLKEQIANLERLNNELAEKAYNAPVERNTDGQGDDPAQRDCG